MREAHPPLAGRVAIIPAMRKAGGGSITNGAKGC